MSRIVRCAVIGNPIVHSLSPKIHKQFAAQFGLALAYDKILGDEQGFEDQVRAFFSKGGRGLNITLPFKTRAYEMATQKTLRAIKAKAANTLWMENDQLHADNTDGIGVFRDISRYVDLKAKKILILGAGGATRGIIMPLLDSLPTELVVANRSKERARAFALDFPEVTCVSMDSIVGRFDVIIHATSSGYAGAKLSLPEVLFSNKPFCYDLSYSLTEATPFISKAIQEGCDAKDGMGMLIEQAAESFFIWHGLKPNIKGF